MAFFKKPALSVPAKPSPLPAKPSPLTGTGMTLRNLPKMSGLMGSIQSAKPSPLAGTGMAMASLPKMSGPLGAAMKSGGSTSSASKRADGCAVRGKTKGKMI